jgi:hypothetical protein
VSRQNQHSAFPTSMDPDQPAHPRGLIRIHAVRLQTLLQVEKLIANSMDPDQTAQAGLAPCWSQTHYVGFIVTRLIHFTVSQCGKQKQGHRVTYITSPKNN